MLRRNLIRLAALTRDPYLFVETRLEFGRDWHRLLSSILRPGDTLVIQPGYWLGSRRRALERDLSMVAAPLWIMNGISGRVPPSHKYPLVELGFWLVSMSIVVGFFILQTKLLQLPGKLDIKILLSLSVLVEIMFLYSWHHLTS